MLVLASTVYGATTNVLLAWSKTKTSLFSAPETSTFLKSPKEMFEDGVIPTDANVLLAGFKETVVAGLLVMTTVVAIIL
jgi:hypothetical protein